MVTFTSDTLSRYGMDQPKALLRSIDPLFRLRPIYLICKTPANSRFLPGDPPKAAAWTSTNLSKRCRGYLESIGEWGGEGFAMMMVHPVGTWAEPNFLADVIHEASHWLEWEVVTKGEDHGPVHIRAALHAAYRASSWLREHGLHGVRLDYRAVLGGNSSATNAAQDYVDALRDELRETGTAIVSHLRRRPPAAFRKLCNDDARSRGLRLPFSSRKPPGGRLTSPPATSGRSTVFVGFIGGRIVQDFSDGTTVMH
jgi:hypothetical protein